MEHRYGSSDSEAGTDDPVDHAECGTWCRLCQLFPLENCTYGTESLLVSGILDYSGRDNRRLAEVKSVHEKFQKLSEIAGSKYEAKVGFLKDYDNAWDSQLDVWHEKVEWKSQLGIFEAAQRTHTPMDYIYLRDDITAEDLKPYSVLFYPHPGTDLRGEKSR